MSPYNKYLPKLRDLVLTKIIAGSGIKIQVQLPQVCGKALSSTNTNSCRQLREIVVDNYLSCLWRL